MRTGIWGDVKNFIFPPPVVTSDRGNECSHPWKLAGHVGRRLDFKNATIYRGPAPGPHAYASRFCWSLKLALQNDSHLNSSRVWTHHVHNVWFCTRSLMQQTLNYLSISCTCDLSSKPMCSFRACHMFEVSADVSLVFSDRSLTGQSSECARQDQCSSTAAKGASRKWKARSCGEERCLSAPYIEQLSYLHDVPLTLRIWTSEQWSRVRIKAHAESLQTTPMYVRGCRTFHPNSHL